MEKICAAKAQLKLRLPELSGKIRRALSNTLMANGRVKIPLAHGHLTNWDRDKVEVFNGFFPSVFNMGDGPRELQ